MTISASGLLSQRRVLTFGAFLVVACSSGAPQTPTATPGAPRRSAVAQEGPDNSDVIRGHTDVHVPDIVLPPPAPISSEAANGDHIDPLLSLIGLIDDGTVTLPHDSVVGYLPALLAALDIDVSSQNLVFSRTSLQTDRIAPWAPRALYFNDDVYVGYVQESPIIEIASIDPDDGAVFYTLRQDLVDKPTFTNETTLCLSCHNSGSVTLGVPGVMTRSVLAGRLGYSAGTLHPGALTDRTPPSERFAGWYITGTHAPGAHAGNVYADDLATSIEDKTRYLETLDLTSDGNVTSLQGRFDHSVYLSGHSDLVAALVLTHQTRVHNIITKAQEDTRDALRVQAAALRSTGGTVAEGEMLPVTEVRVTERVEALLREMMFANAAPIGGPIKGTSTFAEDFTSRGPTDSAGRSLRDFDLQDRLFRYPLSFLVYSDAFDILPDVVLDHFYHRLDEILTGTDTTGDFDYLDTATRTAIREILMETKPAFVEAVGGGG